MKISVDLVANTGSFETDMNRAAKAAEKRAKEIEKAFSKAGTIIGTAFGVGVTAAVAGIVALTKRGIDAADEMGKLAQKTGITTETLSALQYAAKQSGVEDLSGSLVRLNKAIAEGATGTGAQAEAFKALGVSVTNADGSLRGAESVFRDIAEAMSRFEDGPGKTAVALDLFGKSGAALIPLFKDGAVGLDRFTARARELGLVISTKTAAASEEFNDNLGDVKNALDGVGRSVAAEVAPRLAELSRIVSDPKFAQGMQRIVNLAIDATESVAKLVGRIGDLGKRRDLAKLLQEEKFITETIERRTKGAGVLEIFGRDVNSELSELEQRLAGVREQIAALSAPVFAMDDAALAEAQAMEAFGQNAEKASKGTLRYATASEKAAKAAKAAKDITDQWGASLDAAANIKAEVERMGLNDGPASGDILALEAAARAYQRQVDDFGKGPKARRFSAGQDSIDDEFRSSLEGLQADAAGGLLPEGMYERELARLENFHKQRTDQWFKSYADIEAANSDFTLGLEESLQSYLDGARNLGSQLGDGLLNVLDSTGSAISDLTARMVIFGGSGKEAVRGIAQQLSQGLLTSLIDVGIQYVKNSLIERAAISATTAAGIAASQANAAAQVSANATIAASAAPAAALTSLASFGGNSFPALAGIAVVSAAIGALLGGAFADGGDPPVGKISLVGERGPELFIPRTAGTIIPNGAFSQADAAAPAGNQGGGTTIINNAPGITITPRAGRVYIDMLPEWLEMAVEYARDAIGADIGNADSDIGRTLNGRIGAPAGVF